MTRFDTAPDEIRRTKIKEWREILGSFNGSLHLQDYHPFPTDSNPPHTEPNTFRVHILQNRVDSNPHFNPKRCNRQSANNSLHLQHALIRSYLNLPHPNHTSEMPRKRWPYVPDGPLDSKGDVPRQLWKYALTLLELLLGILQLFLLLFLFRLLLLLLFRSLVFVLVG